jgi:hypothetical protein
VISSGYISQIVYSPRPLDMRELPEHMTTLSHHSHSKHYSLLLDPTVQLYASQFSATGTRSSKGDVEEGTMVRHGLGHAMLMDDHLVHTIAGGGLGWGTIHAVNDQGDQFVVMGQQIGCPVSVSRSSREKIVRKNDKGQWEWELKT